VEVLETVEPTAEIIQNCINLKKKGYLIILDDFIFDPKYATLVEIADIIKVDFIHTSKQERKNILQQLNSKKLKFLAEKVETHQEFEEAKELGYCYFQGYFFSKPEIISSQEIPGYKILHLQLLKELYQPEIDFNRLEDIIKKDVSISYKLFKFINSAFFGFSKQISSIKQALVMMGTNEVKKWVTVIALIGMAQDKPEELIVTSLMRAKLCEAVAEIMGLHRQAPELFLTGLFSLIDAMIDRPKDEILKELPIRETIKTALLGNENSYRKILDLIINYEQGKWTEFSEKIRDLMLEESEVPNLFIKSATWTNKIFSTYKN
jgi:EAL and modified HD-GYP domain-containing signal transduction protein